MTTYTLTGTVIYTDYNTDDFVSSDPTGATLEIVVPESVSTLEYSLLPAMYDNPIGEAEIDVQNYNIRINGMTLSDQFSSDGALIANVQWMKSGQIQETVVLDLLFYDVPNTGLGRVDGEYLFEISGDPLPNIGGKAVYNNFYKRISAIEEAEAPFAPDQAIALDSLGAVTVSEADLINGTAGSDVYRSGLGADVVSGLDGDDRLYGEKGRDQLKGGQGNDFVSGGLGNDKLSGNFGHDTLKGGFGNDVMIGGRGRDVLSGMTGNDTMTAEPDATRSFLMMDMTRSPTLAMISCILMMLFGVSNH